MENVKQFHFDPELNIKHEPEEIIIDVNETAGVSDLEVTASDAERFSKSSNSKNKCEFCSQTFQSLSNKKRHLDTVHKFECPTLSSFGKFYNFKEHLKRVHGLTSYAEAKLLLQCDLCLQTYFTRECLIRHMIHFHTKQEYKEVVKREKKAYNLQKKSIVCNLCDHKYSCMSSLRVHKRNAHSGTKRSILCDLCNKLISGKELMRSHMKHIHCDEKGEMRRIQLEQCKLCYRLVRNLTRHLSVFHTDEIYSCDLCEFSTKYPANLRVHKNSVHLKVKRFECKICNKKFKDQSNKNRHMRNIHKSKKRFECYICQPLVTFGRSDNLTFHLKRIHGVTSHSTTKPNNLLHCDICLGTFVYKKGLISHMSRSHLDHKRVYFKCKICPSRFLSKLSLINHLNSVHLKKFCCRYCTKILGSEKSLAKHETLCR